MVESSGRSKELFGYGIAIVTLIVAIWSLYYNSLQTVTAQKSLMLASSEKLANLQKQLAELGKKLAAPLTDKEFAEVLNQLAGLQSQIADQQLEFAADRAGEKALAQLQKDFTELQRHLATLRQEQENKKQEFAALVQANAQKDREIASLKSQIALNGLGQTGLFPRRPETDLAGLAGSGKLPQAPPLGSPSVFLGGTLSGKPPLSSWPPKDLAKSYPLLGPETDMIKAFKAAHTLPGSVPPRAPNFWTELGTVLKNHLGTSIFYGILLIVIISKMSK